MHHTMLIVMHHAIILYWSDWSDDVNASNASPVPEYTWNGIGTR